MGRVKELIPEPDDYKALDDQGPADLEVLAIDAAQARDRYLAALAKHNARKENQREPI